MERIDTPVNLNPIRTGGVSENIPLGGARVNRLCVSVQLVELASRRVIREHHHRQSTERLRVRCIVPALICLILPLAICTVILCLTFVRYFFLVFGAAQSGTCVYIYYVCISFIHTAFNVEQSKLLSAHTLLFRSDRARMTLGVQYGKKE